MSKAFRQSLRVLIEQDATSVSRAIEEAERSFVEAEREFLRDPAVEAGFIMKLPSELPLLKEPVAKADDLRDLILQIDVRWQLDAMRRLEEYVEHELIARSLGPAWTKLGPATSQVEVQIASVGRAWRKSGFDDFWLLLKTDQADLAQVTDASSEADRLAEASGLETPLTMEVESCPGGFYVEIGPGLQPDPICQWISHFVQALDARGITGRLEGTSPPRRDPDFHNAQIAP